MEDMKKVDRVIYRKKFEGKFGTLDVEEMLDELDRSTELTHNVNEHIRKMQILCNTIANRTEQQGGLKPMDFNELQAASGVIRGYLLWFKDIVKETETKSADIFAMCDAMQESVKKAAILSDKIQEEINAGKHGMMTKEQMKEFVKKRFAEEGLIAGVQIAERDKAYPAHFDKITQKFRDMDTNVEA